MPCLRNWRGIYGRLSINKSHCPITNRLHRIGCHYSCLTSQKQLSHFLSWPPEPCRKLRVGTHSQARLNMANAKTDAGQSPSKALAPCDQPTINNCHLFTIDKIIYLLFNYGVGTKELEFFPYKCPHCSAVRNATEVANELPPEVLLRRTRP